MPVLSLKFVCFREYRCEIIRSATGSPDLYAAHARQHLPEISQVSLRERVPVPADQRGGGATQAQRVS